MAAAVVALLAVACLFPVASAAAPRALLDTIGGPGAEGGKFFSARGIAANHSSGDFYVADGANNRIQQFSASGEFIRAWGTDVVVGGETGFEICTVAENCKAGTAEGGAAGEVGGPFGVAVDQTNGYVYVVSNTNKRVDVFSSSGTFAGAFGWGVDTGASALEVCTTASGCQTASAGAGAGQVLNPLIGSSPAIDPTAPPGTIFVPDQANARVSKFATTISGGALSSATFIKAFGWDVAPGAVDEEQEVRIRAGSGQFKLSFEGDTTADLAFNAPAADIQAALNALPSISAGGGSVAVFGGPGDPSGTSPYVVRFGGGPLAGTNVSELTASSGTVPLAGGAPTSSASLLLRAQGGTTTGLESCTAASGCKAGSTGSGSGQFSANGAPASTAVDSTGWIYVVSGPFNNLAGNACTAAAPCRVQKFDPATTVAGDFGPIGGPGQITNVTGSKASEVAALDVAVDPANDHVFVNKKTDATSYRIFEYDSSGVFLEDHPPGDLAAASTFNHGLAVGTDEQLYSGLTGDSVYILGPVADPHPTMGGISDVAATSATFEGTIDVPPPGVAKYHFEYSTDKTNWTSAPPQDKTVGDGTPGEYPVSFEATGLQPNTKYFVRLVATTGNEPVISENEVEVTTLQAPPRVGLLYTEGITQTQAVLGARLDPEGLESSYHFEWTTQSQWEASGWAGARRAPAVDAPLGDGNEAVIAEEPIAGLVAGTSYRVRVVVESAAGETTAEQTFETLNACGYTGNRCLELVSPSDKGPTGAAGSPVALGQEMQFQASFSGSSIAYVMAYGLKHATSGNEVVYQANRQSSGWVSTQLSAPTILPSVQGSVSFPSKIAALSKDLSCGFLTSTELLTPGAPQGTRDAGQANLYRRSADGSHTVITSLEPENPVGENPLDSYDVIGLNEQGIADCGTVIFRTHFTYPGVPGAGSGRLYEWDEGDLYNVGVVPGPGGQEVAEVVPGTSNQGDSLGLSNHWNAVSEDATRTYFTAISRAGGDIGQQAVFMRERVKGAGDLAAGSAFVENAVPTLGEFAVGQEVEGPGIPPGTTIMSVDGETLELSEAATATAVGASLRAIRVIDVSQSQNPGTPNDSRTQYETASTDGGVVFFTARYGLTEEGTPPSSTSCAIGNDEEPNGAGCALYRYSVDDGTLTELSVPAEGTENAEGASVAGVLGASDDGDRVYFAARGQLLAARGATEAQNLAEGAYNVYLSDRGQVSYVGRLGRSSSGAVRNALLSSTRQFWSARVSPDGRYLLFASEVPFTELGKADNGTRQEAYLYDAEASSATCVSCRRDDEASLAPQDAKPLVSGGPFDVENPLRPPATLAVSSEGEARAFFISYNPLATGATAGRPNLFMWENGQVTFLGSSAPSAVRELRFAGASATGDDVYFATVDRLTWQDKDSKLDVYDVRVGGGFPPPPAPPASCNPLVESSCPGAPGAAPAVVPPPVSATFTGPEQVEEKKKKNGKKKKGKNKKQKGKRGKGKQRKGKGEGDKRAGTTGRGGR